jgi:gas vesicle protein
MASGKSFWKQKQKPQSITPRSAKTIATNIIPNMNSKKSFLLAAVLATVTTLSSFAQSTPPTGKPPEKPENQQKPENPGKPKNPEVGRGGRGPGIEVPRIGVPEKVFTTLPQSLQDQISKYREQSKGFIDAQRDMAKTLSTATQEQRNTIREQLKANRDKFLADTQQVRTEIRDQLKDLGVSVRENRRTDGGGSGGGKGPGRPRG